MQRVPCGDGRISPSAIFFVRKLLISSGPWRNSARLRHMESGVYALTMRSGSLGELDSQLLWVVSRRWSACSILGIPQVLSRLDLLARWFLCERGFDIGHGRVIHLINKTEAKEEEGVCENRRENNIFCQCITLGYVSKFEVRSAWVIPTAPRTSIAWYHPYTRSEEQFRAVACPF